MIPVTKPFLPPMEDYYELISNVWKRNWLTNNGPLVNELELHLKEYLDLPHILYLSNGTIALQIAIKALKLTGEIITTPFSYVATTNSIIWEGCSPVFVDIDEKTFNIDPRLIESAITNQTSAILATHVYGNPCEVDAIGRLAERYKLKVIYDAAHCFGTKLQGRSIFDFGDISTASFHATKIFHTIEGGAIMTPDPELLKRMAYLRNFGHEGKYDFKEAGINGKNSEFHAAMGLCNLNYIEQILNKRKLLSQFYDHRLENLCVEYQKIHSDTEYNYSYYPVLFQDESLLLRSQKELEKHNIFTRRYFFPSLNKLEYLTNNIKLNSSESIATRILCLPLYHDLTYEEIEMVSRILLRVQNN